MGANSNALKAYDLLAAQPVSVKDLPDRVRADIVISAVTDMNGVNHTLSTFGGNPPIFHRPQK